MTDIPPDNPEEQYQGPGTAAQTSTIYHAEIDPSFQELAKDNLWASLQGNGIKQDEIELTKFDGETLEFICATILTLSTKVSDKRQAGKITGAVVLGNEQAVRDAITKEEHKITHAQDVIKRIKDVLLEREDKGFFLEHEYIKLPFLHKQFVVYEPCNTCRSQGKLPCNRCGGKGIENCTACNASGRKTCASCNGRQFLQGPNGQKQNCMTCNAQGYMACNYCNGQQQTTCSTCKGSRSMTCQNCNGHAWISHIFMAEIDAYADFEYDRQNLPEKIVTYIDHLGNNLPQHVEIIPIRMQRETEKDVIALPYQVRIPHADVIFRLKDKIDVGGFMFGTQGWLFSMPFFLERLMKPGMKLLQKAGKGRGDIAEHLQKAGRYRTLRQIILAVSKLPPARALEKILEKTPIGLSEDMAKKLIVMADRALKEITNKPRQIGTAIGILSASTLYGLYFYGLRSMILSALPPMPPIQYALDMFMLGTGITIAILAIQTVAANAMKKALGVLMQGQQKTGRIKAGEMAYLAIGGCIATFFIAAYFTLYTGSPSPHWIIEISNLIQ